MCGRFTLRTPSQDIASFFAVKIPDSFQTTPFECRYNIAPSQDVAVIVQDPESDQYHQWKFFRWGLIPSWSKDAQIGYKLINARAETLSDKPSFRSAFQRRRCLVVADGFYEWQNTATGKQPYHFCREDGCLIAFAGLWEKWSQDPTIYSCTIVTTSANELLSPFHDRMPVILDQPDHQLWLDPNFGQTDLLQKRLQPYPADQMTFRRANRLVNNVKNETPECLDPENKPRQNELF